MKNNDSGSPKLDRPGAGLPRPELLVAQILFGLRRRRGTRESFLQVFKEEAALIEDLIKPLDSETATEPVLIRRLRGLEDSSRNWSPLMVVDHLRIVNLSIAGVIRLLPNGETPDGKVSTADVKPDPEVGPEVVDELAKVNGILLRIIERIEDLKTDQTHDHPWFGPLDAHGWLALASVHMGIHRKQLEAILAASPSS